MKKLFLLTFSVALCALGLDPVSAQPPGSASAPETTAAPGSLVAHNAVPASARPVSSASSVNAATRQPNQTKIVRIYGGAGFFDLALAEKLRPRLAKGFTATKSNPLRTLPDAVPVPDKAESKPEKTASNL